MPGYVYQAYFNRTYTMAHIVDPYDISSSLCGRKVPYKSSRYASMAIFARRCKICTNKLKEQG